MKHLLIILLMFSASTAQGFEFNKRHYLIIKDIISVADQLEVPREALLALCWGESSFKRNATHMDGGSLSHGACQVKMDTAKFVNKVFHLHLKITEKKLENTKFNADIAAHYLLYKLSMYDGDMDKALDAYNKGHLVSSHSKYVKKFHKNTIFINEHLDLTDVVE